MLALIATPGRSGSLRVADVPVPSPDAGGVRIRTLEIGICGTDREIAGGGFGVAPPGERDLVLGHELLGEVVADGDGFSAGDLVTATVRRSCGLCPACAADSPDSCRTGEYAERGITRLHGFASQLVVERREHLVGVPASLGRLGVLVEPASVCARGIRHALEIGRRQEWIPERALVIGAGTVGILATYQLRLLGFDVWTADREVDSSDKARLVAFAGAEYVSTAAVQLGDLREAVGGFDLVVEASGDAEVMLAVLGLLRRNGVGCLLGLDSHHRPLSISSTVIGLDAVLENRALFGSVNAHSCDWRAAVEGLEQMRRFWPEALETMIGLRVPLDCFEEAFAFRGIKATLVFE